MLLEVLFESEIDNGYSPLPFPPDVAFVFGREMAVCVCARARVCVAGSCVFHLRFSALTSIPEGGSIKAYKCKAREAMVTCILG